VASFTLFLGRPRRVAYEKAFVKQKRFSITKNRRFFALLNEKKRKERGHIVEAGFFI